MAQQVEQVGRKVASSSVEVSLSQTPYPIELAVALRG